MISTNTDCSACTHKKVCKNVNKHNDVVNDLDLAEFEEDFNADGIDIIVSCKNFDKSIPVPRTPFN